jgi:hypothetical protein
VQYFSARPQVLAQVVAVAHLPTIGAHRVAGSLLVPGSLGNWLAPTRVGKVET